MKIVTMSMLLLLGTQAFAARVKTHAGSVTFLAKGNPGFMKIEGSSKEKSPIGDLDVTDGKLQGQFAFELKHLTTGMDLRDEHMKEKYLEVAKFPQAKLVLKPMAFSSSEDSDGKFTGDLTLHGVTKEVSGTYSYEASGKKVEAKFSIKVSDFGIDIPSWMGVTVTDFVDINVTSELH